MRKLELFTCWCTQLLVSLDMYTFSTSTQIHKDVHVRGNYFIMLIIYYLIK